MNPGLCLQLTVFALCSERRRRAGQVTVAVGILLAAIAVALIAPANAHAAHRISGVVRNTQGTQIVGARVSCFWNSDGREIGYGVTDSNGAFSFDVSPVNEYTNLFTTYKDHYGLSIKVQPPSGSDYAAYTWSGLMLFHDWLSDSDRNVGESTLRDVVPPTVYGVRQSTGWFSSRPVPTTWQNASLQDLYFSAGDGGVGTREYWYKMASPAAGAYGPETKNELTRFALGEGTHMITFYAIDKDDNRSVWSAPVTVSIDLTKPVTSTDGLGVWAKSVKLKATDNLSGVKQTYRTVDGGTATLVTDGTFDVPTEGTHSLTYWSVDNAGNTEVAKTATVKVDLTKPVTSFVPASRYFTGDAIPLNASDALSGVDKTYWRFGASGAFNVGATAQLPDTSGTYLFTYYSVDKAGNTEAELRANLVVEAKSGSLTGIVTDAGGGPLSGVVVSIPGLPGATTGADGRYTIPSLVPGTYVVSLSKAGYEAQSRSVSIEAGQQTISSFVLGIATGTIRGIVSGPGGALGGVSVAVSGGPSVSTGVDGSYLIGLVPGTYSVVFSKTGYIAQTVSINITAAGITTKNVTLAVVPVPSPDVVVTSLSLPGASPSRPTHGKYATFTTYLNSGPGAMAGTSKLSLYRWESKTVRKKVRGKSRKVKVNYWRLRATKPMAASADGRLTLSYKLPYSGKWKMVASYDGATGYMPATSGAKTFSAK